VHCNLDDQFHVTKIWLAYNWHDQSPGAEVDSSGQFPRQSGTIEFPRLASALGSRRVEFRETVEVSRIGTLPVGSQLRFSILAKDNDTYDKDKPPGRSTEVILDVVSESTLRIDLQKREQLQAKLLAELIDSQQRALTDLRALAADVNGTDEVAPDDRRKLSSLFQQARAAQSLLVGVAARLEKIVIEAHNNRLEKEDGPLAERLRGKIVQPLEQLTAEQTPQLARLLQAARRNERHADPRDAALAQATDVQQAIVARLEEIRRHLILSPDFQDVLKQIIKIQEEQAKLRDATLKEKEDRILGKPDEAEEGKP